MRVEIKKVAGIFFKSKLKKLKKSHREDSHAWGEHVTISIVSKILHQDIGSKKLPLVFLL